MQSSTGYLILSSLIIKWQQGTDLIILRAPFWRLVLEIMAEVVQALSRPPTTLSIVCYLIDQSGCGIRKPPAMRNRHER